jgi:hypothetical protein
VGPPHPRRQGQPGNGGDLRHQPPGQVTYSWGTADVATAGLYDAEIEVLWNDGKAETFPSGSYWTVLITEDID